MLKIKIVSWALGLVTAISFIVFVPTYNWSVRQWGVPGTQ